MSILLSKVIVSASSAVALAIDAGGIAKKEGIWVADLTKRERSFGTA